MRMTVYVCLYVLAYQRTSVPVTRTQGMSQSVLDDEAFFEQTPHNQDMLQLGNTAGRLHISCVTPAHAGEYACVAQTPTERIVSRTFLEVGEYSVLQE